MPGGTVSRSWIGIAVAGGTLPAALAYEPADQVRYVPVAPLHALVAGLADALLRGGDLKEAVAAVGEVLPAVENGVTSVRCLNRLRLIRTAAASAPWADDSCARFDTGASEVSRVS